MPSSAQEYNWEQQLDAGKNTLQLQNGGVLPSKESDPDVKNPDTSTTPKPADEAVDKALGTVAKVWGPVRWIEGALLTPFAPLALLVLNLIWMCQAFGIRIPKVSALIQLSPADKFIIIVANLLVTLLFLVILVVFVVVVSCISSYTAYLQCSWNIGGTAVLKAIGL